MGHNVEFAFQVLYFFLMYQATCHQIHKNKNQSSCKKEELLISQILIQNGVYMENQHDYGIKYQFCWYRIDSNNNKVIIVRKLVLV